MKVEPLISLIKVSSKSYQSIIRVCCSIFILLLIGFILMITPITGCAAKSILTAQPESNKEQSMPVEQLVEKAETLYNFYLKKGLIPEDAVRKVVDYLNLEQNIKEAKATSASSIKVIFKDGNDLFILLGKSRI